MSTGFQTIRRDGLAPEKPRKTRRIEQAVVLSPFFWNFRDDMWQTTHHVAQALARRLPTVLVEPPVQWNPNSEEFRWHRIRTSCIGSRIETAGPALDVFHRRGFPLGRLEAFRNIQGKSNARALARFLRKTGARPKMLWHSFPYWSEPLVDAINPKLFVYHCLDYSPREEERRLVQRADVVFCVSQALVDKYSLVNPHTFLLPNGVDLDLFDPERAARAPRPADLPRNGPVIGFAGYLNRHADFELIASVAKAYPRCKVVLLGRTAKGHAGPQGRQREAMDKLKSLPNVELLGFKPPHQLPAYLHAFDICLIPLLRNRFNQERDPMKFYQYMAMGKPVVTTPVPVARRYPDACYMAQTHDGFIAAIGEALGRKDNEEERQRRLAIAQRHSWPALVDRASRIITQQRCDRDSVEIPPCT